MKNSIILFFMITITPFIAAQDLTISIEGIKSSQGGKLFVGVYDAEGTFTKVGKEVKGEYIEISDQKTATVEIKDLPAGTYSVSIFHDKNRNGKLDSGWFGIPKEGYGFSNNIYGRFSTPSFAETNFATTNNGTTQLSIKMIYR